jgi:hypothetical protein
MDVVSVVGAWHPRSPFRRESSRALRVGNINRKRDFVCQSFLSGLAEISSDAIVS